MITKGPLLQQLELLPTAQWDAAIIAAYAALPVPDSYLHAYENNAGMQTEITVSIQRFYVGDDGSLYVDATATVGEQNFDATTLGLFRWPRCLVGLSPTGTYYEVQTTDDDGNAATVQRADLVEDLPTWIKREVGDAVGHRLSQLIPALCP